MERRLDLILKLATPLGVVVMILLQNQFVTRAEFAKAQDPPDAPLQKTEPALTRMEAGADTDKRHDAQLTDHENRLRGLERR